MTAVLLDVLGCLLCRNPVPICKLGFHDVCLCFALTWNWRVCVRPKGWLETVVSCVAVSAFVAPQPYQGARKERGSHCCRHHVPEKVVRLKICENVKSDV